MLLSVLVLAASFIGAAGPVLALDLERLFPQRLDRAFYEQLIDRQGHERAVFLTAGQREIIFYMRYAEGGFVLRGQLEASEDRLLASAFEKAETVIFSPLKADGTPLYRRGTARRLSLKLSGGRVAAVVYVQRFINGVPNDCFVCDAGYIEIAPGSTPPSESELSELFGRLTAGAMTLSRQVALNRYYMYRDNYLGPVERFATAEYPDLLAGPAHKVTFYKSLRDNRLKAHKDKKLTIGLLAEHRFLLSQDLRLKLGMVPSTVVLKPENLDNSDLGSGQNHMVFLTVGPGINYFDDPWQQPRENVPCPRMIFHRDALRFEKMQVFPTYSIEPGAKGIGRLQSINGFQNGLACNASFTEAVWPDENRKSQFLGKIEDALCRYGLLNDSPDLEPGFVFEDRLFNGNIVNNELRLHHALAVRDLMTAVIVPPGMKKSYDLHYRIVMRGTAPHWDFNCGIHFHDLFIEAVEPSDKAFRAAWLMLVVRETHPAVYRLLKNARALGRNMAFMKIAGIISDSAARQGRSYFETPYFRAYQKLDRERNQLWLDYLEACREGRSDADGLLHKYRAYYDRMKTLCD